MSFSFSGAWLSVTPTIKEGPYKDFNVVAPYQDFRDTDTPFEASMIFVWKLVGHSLPGARQPSQTQLESILNAVTLSKPVSTTASVVARVKEKLLEVLFRDYDSDETSPATKASKFWRPILPAETAVQWQDVNGQDLPVQDALQLPSFIGQRIMEGFLHITSELIESCIAPDFPSLLEETLARFYAPVTHPPNSSNPVCSQYRNILFGVYAKDVAGTWQTPIPWLDNPEARETLKKTFTAYLAEPSVMSYPAISERLETIITNFDAMHLDPTEKPIDDLPDEVQIQDTGYPVENEHRACGGADSPYLSGYRWPVIVGTWHGGLYTDEDGSDVRRLVITDFSAFTPIPLRAPLAHLRPPRPRAVSILVIGLGFALLHASFGPDRLSGSVEPTLSTFLASAASRFPGFFFPDSSPIHRPLGTYWHRLTRFDRVFRRISTDCRVFVVTYHGHDPYLSGAKKEEEERAEASGGRAVASREERARQTPVSTPIPPSFSSTPISVSSAAANDAETVNVMNYAGRRTFSSGHPALHYTPEVQEFIYGVSRSPSPAPAGLCSSPPHDSLHDSNWYRDDDEIPTILTVHVTSVPAPRDFSALRSTGFYSPRDAPRPFPKSHPKRTRTIISAPRADVFTVHDHVPIRPPTPTPLAPVHTTSLFGLKDPIPVLVLPRPQPLPYDPYYFAPRETPTPDRVLPAETFYGVVQSGLALVCAYEYPWVHVARGNIAEIAWGACPPDMYDEREDVLDLLPPDQLVFLAVLLEICRLEPHFTSFVEPAVADFVNAWLAHCYAFG
ncbi:hypothetical protein C8R43DRAFT_1126506 [Mycena crocata]|nr:hypothetical protein C8R43DRAFT_1126506 [Mycena crocata]